MRILLTTLLIALLAVPLLSQAVDVGGSFGQNWIATSGNKNIYSNATGLWSWGMIPLGNIMQNGQLVSTGDQGTTELIYPAFPEGVQNLIVGNKSINAPQNGPRGLTQTQLNSPYLQEDPWVLAQSINQPILIQPFP